jgi:hypothetical protein
MKLFEFFSKNNVDEQEEKIETDLEKDLMGFILDDDDLYKEYLHPVARKIAKGKDIDSNEFMDTVDAACLKFYKENDFKKDPNEIFPIEMRKRIAGNLLDINKNGRKKDEDKTTVK